MKSLTVYFSCTGVTKKLAEKIAAVTGSELYEITPEIPYTKADLNWMNSESRSSLEMKDYTSRPAIAGDIPDISQYEVIYLGFPIWWYVAPTIIRTFLESRDFTGKVIFPFCTSGSSQPGDTDAFLREVCPNAEWKETVRFGKNAGEDRIKQWSGLE